MSANQNQVCTLSLSLFWAASYEAGNKAGNFHLPSDPVSYIIPGKLTGSEKNVNPLFGKLGSY